MASETYWEERAARIDLAKGPMSPEALIGNGPWLATCDAIVLEVVGRHKEARLLLDSFFPDLMALLSDKSAFECYPDYEKLSRLVILYNSAHIANWLLHGEFDATLGQATYDAEWNNYRFHCPKAKADIILLLNLMLLRIESGRFERAKKLYEANEKKNIQIPPESLRFARNPRALLYAHLHSDKIPHQHLHAARESFRKAGTQWEKDVDPVQNVLLPDAARVFSACLRLIKKPCGPSEIFGLLR